VSTASWTRSNSQSTWLPRIHSRKLRVFAVLLVIVLVAGVGWLWYRSSSFVKIRQVSVVGLTGPEIPQIRAALDQSALTMTTLDVNMGRLDAAVSEYPTVRSLSVTTEGHHAIVISVNEQVPVAILNRGGQTVAVDGYGRLLTQSTVPHGALPTLPLAVAPSGNQITDAGTLTVLQVLQAAPYQWIAHTQSANSSTAHGVVLVLRNGPEVYFGPANELAAKWAALTAVLQSSGSQGAAYIDVTDPQRPAAGVAVTTATTPSATSTTVTSGASGDTAGGTTVTSGTTGDSSESTAATGSTVAGTAGNTAATGG
jgi:cell division septal protein FtsQ